MDILAFVRSGKRTLEIYEHLGWRHVVAKFPAKEALGEYTDPKFGENPGDMEMITADIKEGAASEFFQIPRFEKAFWAGDTWLHCGAQSEASPEATEKIRRFISRNILLGKLGGEISRTLAIAFKIKHMIVIPAIFRFFRTLWGMMVSPRAAHC